MERWIPSDQVFPTSESMKAFFQEGSEWDRIRMEWEAKFRADGGANGEGVEVVPRLEAEEGVEKRGRRSSLIIDLEVSLTGVFFWGEVAEADCFYSLGDRFT